MPFAFCSSPKNFVFLQPHYCAHLVPRCTEVTMMPPNKDIFIPPKKHLIKHEDKGSRRDP